MMGGMNLTKVVNMIGGKNAWEAASYPVTSDFAPLLMAVSDRMRSTDMPVIGVVDTIVLTITNRWNSSLTFDTVSYLAETEFSTDFNLDTTLTGAEDYTFRYFMNYWMRSVIPLIFC